jgi:hypothetical protein
MHDLRKAIKKWGEPVQLDEPRCKEGCKCEEVDEDDVDWDKKKKHKRTFQDTFESKDTATTTSKFIVFADVEFKVAIVPKGCIEPPGEPIWKAWMGDK